MPTVKRATAKAGVITARPTPGPTRTAPAAAVASRVSKAPAARTVTRQTPAPAAAPIKRSIMPTTTRRR